MKLKSLTIALALAATSASSFAAEKEGFFIGAFGDYYDASWENVRGSAGTNVDDSTGWGAELGYRFNDYWSARLEYADMDFDISSSNPAMTATSMDGDRLGIDGLYHINGGPFYGIFGLKQLDITENLMFANLGAGYQHYFTDNFAFNAEATMYQGLDRGYTDVAGKLGLSYIFGEQGSSAPVEAAPTAAVVPVAVAPVDSDGDNIPDADDQCANTPMTDAVDGTGCTLYEDREVTKSLLITFPNNTSKVSQKYLDDIDAAVAFLKEYPGTEVLLEGHTSSVGKADYNKWLSKKRADAVAARLIEDGIDKKRIITVGLGEERLKNPANTAEAHAENRRVEAHVTVIERVKVER
ncbi:MULTISPECIES: OmpA family protein [Pseudoalteromonas]|uniref:OmpA family protein n=1 Tax=Pseudoalteromonas haloplanktis TaxID=228 RepID=A0ABU1BDH8_PSEHA|nr:MULTISPECIES: OmpA family protein [Pseudoalteromonas]MCF6145860.1 OmpA-OmpF porin, OOP family [Pseudoalteromonas mariniglutinosa NCIMB 1770]MDQ9092558.1 OmpA family protein [Pseudoalteromonas haloplanktis]TMN71202.1 hypothetical protein CWB85_12105 [Pseudoalteromonas sp. S1727]BDF95697.1 porin [Pseudoalteromonas sp. KAN5]